MYPEISHKLKLRRIFFSLMFINNSCRYIKDAPTTLRNKKAVLALLKKGLVIMKSVIMKLIATSENNTATILFFDLFTRRLLK